MYRYPEVKQIYGISYMHLEISREVTCQNKINKQTWGPLITKVLHKILYYTASLLGVEYGSKISFIYIKSVLGGDGKKKNQMEVIQIEDKI